MGARGNFTVLEVEEFRGRRGLHFTIGFWICLCGISDENQLSVWQPRMNLLHTVDFVILCAEGQIRQQTSEVHPRSISQNQSSVWEILFPELAEERVEVVWGGREVEPG